MPHPIRHRVVLLALIAILSTTGLALAQPQSGNGEAWDALTALRDALVDRGPQRIDFKQMFTPAGFKTGDEEQGRLSLSLPDCLRWDYSYPYQKVYLLCGSEVYSWNPGEPSGRRYPVDSEQAPGLDLLRMRVEALRDRYDAELTRHDDRVSVTLQPLRAADIRDATFDIDPRSQRLLALSYHDQEGNLTRFEFSGDRPLGDLTLFSPPRDLAWQSN